MDLRLQRYDRDDTRVGITDIEIRSKDLHVIVEAKRGWGLPSRAQITKYAPILSRSNAESRRFVALTRWGTEAQAVIEADLGSSIEGFPIIAVGLGDVLQAARRALPKERSTRPRLFLRELITYLDEGGYVANQRDNRVLVVPLGTGASEIGVPYHRVPYEKGVYWYGLSGNQKLPPNYVAFRFNGRLQSIHHVEESRFFGLFSEVFPDATQDWGRALFSLSDRPSRHRACDLGSSATGESGLT